MNGKPAIRLSRLHRLGLCLVLGAAVGTTCTTTPGVPGVPGTPGTPQGGSTFPRTADWNRRTVNTGAIVRPAAVVTADFDGDGLLDAAVGFNGQDATQPGVRIFFQADPDTFTAVPLAADAAFAGLAALALGDLDGDTHPDIVAACNGGLVFLHSPVDPRQSAGWSFSVIAGSTAGDVIPWNDVAIGNIDGASGLDVVACGGTPGRVAWFVSPAANITNGTGWTRVDIDAQTRAGAAAVALGDVDNDGQIDVYSTAPNEQTGRVAWYKRPTNPQTQQWAKNVIGNLEDADRLAIGDLDGDNDTDLVVTDPTGRRVGWYVRPLNPTTAWSGFLIGQYASATPTDVRVADVDGNGQLDVVVATRQPGSLRWFTPVGAKTDVWTENNLRDLSEAAGRIALGLVNPGSRIDVVAPLLATDVNADTVAWFENPEP